VAEDAERFFCTDPEWRFARGEALFNLARFDEAREALEPLTLEEFDEPMVYYLLACLCERRGEDEAARRLFETANRLSPQEFAVPVALSEEQATEIYEQCMLELPDAIAWHLKEVPIFVAPLPSDDLVRSFDPPLDPLLLGVFLGQPRGTVESSWASDQPRIILFHKNIAKIAGDFETVEDELRKTLFHEVGHYLGFDEDQLEEMGLA
jgi:predicted Zn-dependent protease with MMP-like domain